MKFECDPLLVQVASFRKQLEKLVADKHEEVMCRMGAILAAGILDAGGRNVAASLRSPAGHFRRTAVLGLAMFAQYWFWYPLSYFFSLALRPTALIGLDSTLRTPQFEVRVSLRPSWTILYAMLDSECLVFPKELIYLMLE